MSDRLEAPDACWVAAVGPRLVGDGEKERKAETGTAPVCYRLFFLLSSPPPSVSRWLQQRERLGVTENACVDIHLFISGAVLKPKGFFCFVFINLHLLGTIAAIHDEYPRFGGSGRVMR